jgi:hypothetical protein
MPETNNQQPEFKEHLNDIIDISEREQVPLTPEVEEYLFEGLDKMVEKIQNGEDVREDDMEFLGDIKAWLQSTEGMREHLTLRQCRQLLKMAEELHEGKKWIDETFEFENGKIICKGDLDLRNTPITSLPDNLSVGGYLDLENTPIKSLPDNLSVEGDLDLRNTPMTSLPDNLSVGEDLFLQNTQIESLPDNLSVGGGLVLSQNAPDSLKEDAWRLKREGKIDDIEYIYKQ